MLDILIVIAVCLFVPANCKYCTYRVGFGKSNHFYCGAFEYCCGDRCCENFDEFYKLWYFWLCVLVLVMSGCIAIYWLKRKYAVQQLFRETHVDGDRPPRSRRRRHRRYRQLPANTVPPNMVIPDSVTTSPPPYSGDNTGCPHPGPPPYTLGSGSSINSTTLPRFPPSYEQVEKLPPPSYSSIVEVVVVDDSKKSCDNDDSQS